MATLRRCQEVRQARQVVGRIYLCEQMLEILLEAMKAIPQKSSRANTYEASMPLAWW
jgi:hypothetical protein